MLVLSQLFLSSCSLIKSSRDEGSGGRAAENTPQGYDPHQTSSPAHSNAAPSLTNDSARGTRSKSALIGQESDTNKKISLDGIGNDVSDSFKLPEDRTLPAVAGHRAELLQIIPLATYGRVLTVDSAGQVLSWREHPKSARLLFEIPGGADVVAFSESLSLLAVSKGTKLALYSLARGKLEQELLDLKTRTSSLDFDAAGTALLIGGVDGVVYRWRFVDAETAKTAAERERTFERYFGHPSVVAAVRFHPRGRVFFSGDWQGNLNAWLPYDADAFKGEYDQNLFGSRGYSDKSTRTKVARTDTTSITSLDVSRDGERLFVGLQDGSVECWGIRGLAPLTKLPQAIRGSIFDIAVSPSGKIFAAVGRSGVLRLWTIQETQVFGTSRKEFQLVSLRDIPASGSKTIAFLDDATLWLGEAKGGIVEIKIDDTQGAPHV